MVFKKILIKNKESISEISALAASICAGNIELKKLMYSVMGYYNLYNNLLKLKPSKSKYHIRIYKYKDNFDHQEYIYVDGYRTNPKKDAYALEFNKWEEWLGMSFIDCINNEKLAIAYCLWEMTFFGFDQKKIYDQKQELMNRVKEIKEGKAKLIPAEEVFKKLRKKINDKKKK